MRRRQKDVPVVGLFLMTVADIIAAWGARWALQLIFFGGLGFGIGLGTSLWIVQKVVKQVCL